MIDNLIHINITITIEHTRGITKVNGIIEIIDIIYTTVEIIWRV